MQCPSLKPEIMLNQSNHPCPKIEDFLSKQEHVCNDVLPVQVIPPQN